MRNLFIPSLLAAAGVALFATTAAQAVPPCTSDPALNACNKYGFSTNLCQQCKSCLGKGGKVREVTFRGKRSIMCEMEARKVPNLGNPGTPKRPSKPAAPSQ